MPQDSSPTPARRTRLGLVQYSLGIARRARGQLAESSNLDSPLEFLRAAIRLGAGAIQIPFGAEAYSSAAVAELRELAEKNTVRLEGIVSLPKADSELARFSAELGVLQQLGITVARTVVFTGRRYETFRTLAEFRAARGRGRRMLESAEPLALRHRIRLAVENHKDQRADELIEMVRGFDSGHIGICLDVGNSIALLEDPLAVAEALAPFAFTVHFKDQAVREFENGFLLADTPLGTGAIDLPRLKQIILAQQPGLLFHLELITRDPLKVPILSDSYWPTLPGIKAAELAERWRDLKARSSAEPFPAISTLPLADQVRAERANLEQSFCYAADHLGFAI